MFVLVKFESLFVVVVGFVVTTMVLVLVFGLMTLV
jgi:hypothetical protein